MTQQHTHHSETGGACCHAHHAKNKPAPVLKAGEKAIYVCPMHPAVRQEGAGTCPLCGMALEPEIITDAGAPNPELADMTRRLQGAVALGLPVWLAMLLPLFDRAHLMTHGALNHWQMLFATPVVLWAGWPFFKRGWDSVKTLNLNMFTLIALGTGAAFLYSAAATLAPAHFPDAFRQKDGSVAVYFEAAVTIVALVLLGQVLELRAREKTGDAIRALMNLSPKTARRVQADGREEDVPLDGIAAGDALRVRAGEKVPTDGTVLEGESSIDASLVTGESMPVVIRVGDVVTGGTLNGAGSFVMRAQKVGADTLLAHIVALVAQAQRSRAPVQALADKVSMWFVPAVAAIAVFSAVCWALFGPAPVGAHALLAAVAVLIIACPCALGLATPMSVMVGIGRGARAGVLVRQARALEQLEKAQVLIVDKTGTLTQGKPAVISVAAAAGFSEEDVVRFSAALEKGSEHPLAFAVLAAAEVRGISPAAVENFEAIAGKGVAGAYQAAGGSAQKPMRLALGNKALMDEQGADISSFATAMQQAQAQGATAVFLSVDGKAAGMIAIADALKPNAAQSVSVLKRAGLRIVMATGDAETTAKDIARQLGIEDVRAGILPQGKHALVKEFQAQGMVVAMAGDGVNDAPALSAADVGIAMGTGADVALQSADITLLQGDIAGIVRARGLSRAVMRNIRQNLFFAFVYNAAGVPIAGGLLYPFFGMLLSPSLAALVMSLSSVCVIGNALRLKWQKI